LEVPSPALEQSLSSRLLQAGIGTLAAFAVAVAFVGIVVGWQPVGAPWWLYADADATYTASGIELMAGEHTFYLDHPGMPLQDAMSMTTEMRYLAHKLTNEHETPHAYAGRRLLDLDDSRVWFRGWAILFYVAGALFAFVALWRLLGNPWWGTAGTLLFLAAPGLQEMSIQFRPDGLLAGSVLAVGYLIVRAAERRDAWLYTLAMLLLGLALTVKIHAACLFLPFAIALAWRPPPADWARTFGSDARAWLHRYRVPLVAFVVVWIAFCATFDPGRVHFSPTPAQRTTCLELAAGFGGFLALVAIVNLVPRLRSLARGPLLPYGAALALALAIGVLLPGTPFVNDLPEMLVKMVGGLTGGGVNQGVAPFTIPWSELRHEPFLQAELLLALAGVAAALGARRGDARPVLWFSGAAVAFVMALARLGDVHYFAPAFVLSVPAALWLVRRLPGRLGPGAAAAVVAVALLPVFQNLTDPANAATLAEARSTAIDRLGAELVTQPGTVGLSDDYVSPTADVRWFSLVHEFVAWAPPYPYRLLSDYSTAESVAVSQHLLPTYYIGFRPAQLAPGRAQRVSLPIGTYVMRPLADTIDARLGIGAARLLSGPGVDRPFGHPDARYDPATGYYRDAAGYWNLFGEAIVHPARRRYVAKLGLWADAYGDLWTATGRRVRNDPAYRTAK
jgi:hypothetical protein